ncbi:MAG: spore coat associated protein CotJA [Eubacteriales bacterium]|nr:spore coat associated protein CotJA [Eubacteriales bacterium]
MKEEIYERRSFTLNNIEVQNKLGCYQEPYIGMPIGNLRDYDCYRCPEPEHTMPECAQPDYIAPERVESACSAVDACPLAMAYVPMQRWRDIYEPAKALSRGTIFAELDLPFLGGGAR